MLLKRLYETVAEMAARLDELGADDLEDWRGLYAALHALQVQAQALLDMVRRLASLLGYAPETPRDAARILHDEGLLARDELELVRRVAGFRNIVVHEYLGVDVGLVKRIVLGREYRRLVALAARLLEGAAERGLDDP